MAEWRSNIKWAPVMIASIAAIIVLGTMGMLTAPIGLGIALVTALVAAMW